MSNEYKTFEELIKLNLCDENATITGCELGEKFGSQFLFVNYTVTDEFTAENDLYYKDRTLEILLKRGENYEGLPISSYANRKEA